MLPKAVGKSDLVDIPTGMDFSTCSQTPRKRKTRLGWNGLEASGKKSRGLRRHRERYLSPGSEAAVAVCELGSAGYVSFGHSEKE